MSSIKQTLKSMMLVGGLYAIFHIPGSLLADNSVFDLGRMLNGFGFSVREACTSDDENGQCWLLSILLALEHAQPHSLVHGLPVSHAEIANIVLNHLDQRNADKEAIEDWQPAHQLNTLLVQTWNLTILTIEVSGQGILHIVLTTPSDTGYEQQVIFFGVAESLLVSDLQIAQTLQQLLLTADISLVLTPGHVQPVILTPSEHYSGVADIVLPMQVVSSPARILLLSELLLYIPGSEWQWSPDFNARYGAVRRRVKKDPDSDDYRKPRAEKYQKHKISEHRRTLIRRSLVASVTLMAVGTGYVYRKPIIRFIQPYWDNRAHYYEVMIQRLNHWKESSKYYTDKFVTMAYPYWVSAQATSKELLNRYYWLQDTSTCVKGAKVIIPVAEDGSYRVKGMIAGQSADLLVDSGATSVSMSAKKARQLGLSHFAQMGTLTKCHTASHMNIDCYRISLSSVQVGCIKLFNVDATVMESENDDVLLGMSFLDRLNWSKEGRFLELQAE